MSREPTTMGDTPGAIVKTAKSATPASFIKTVIAKLIAEYGYDAVRYVVEKFRPKPATSATSAAGAGLAVLALVALGKHGRGSKRHSKRRRR